MPDYLLFLFLPFSFFRKGCDTQKVFEEKNGFLVVEAEDFYSREDGFEFDQWAMSREYDILDKVQTP